jgi:histidinol-phosphate aminotransferase
VVFVANPNNPTGSFLPKGDLARLHAGLPSDVLLVIDQAYAEYVAPQDEDGALALAESADNVLVTRTFSKIYGLAGERLGWATGAAPLVDALNRIRGPFNLSNSAQAMGLAAVADQAFVEAAAPQCRHARRFVEQLNALSNHGVRPLPSEANFVLILFEGKLTAERSITA